MKRRFLLFALIASLTLSLFPSALAEESGSLDNFSRSRSYTAGQFSDVSSTDWYAGGVKNAYELGLMSGSSGTKFNPQGEITIRETVTIAAIIHSTYYGNTIPDADGPWYQKYIDYAIANGIVKETTDTTAKATRLMFAYILSKALPDSALKAINSISSIPDVDSDAWYCSAVLKLYNAGVITGSDEYGTFNPGTTIKRSSVASIVAKMADESLRSTFTPKVKPAEPLTVVQKKDEETANNGISDSRYASTNDQFITATSSGYLALDHYDGNTTASWYNKSFKLTSKKTIKDELELFGGYYEGENYIYIAYGQENMEEDDSKTVVRVVKFDKDMNRISSCDISDCYTTIPFYDSSLRMAENGNTLVVYTSRQRYLTTDDGLRHQSNMFITIDTSTMKQTNTVTQFQKMHVSHSFNQFVQYDGNTMVLVDLGDGYPRAVNLQQLTYRDDGKLQSYKESELLEIPGAVGANATGVSIGGFEIAESNYLTVVTTVDQSLVTNYSSSLTGTRTNIRDVELLVTNKDLKNGTTTVKKLTNYTSASNTTKTARNSQLVKISDNCFAVMWVEYDLDTNKNFQTAPDLYTVKYVLVDGSGNTLGSVQTLKGYCLSSTCQPIYANGSLVWYVDYRDAVGHISLNFSCYSYFYKVPVSY